LFGILLLIEPQQSGNRPRSNATIWRAIELLFEDERDAPLDG